MSQNLFDDFFAVHGYGFVDAAIRSALDEDGPDLTSRALFARGERLSAELVAKERLVVCGLPLIPRILDALNEASRDDFTFEADASDGDEVLAGTLLARLSGPAAALLKAERVILNFLCHLSGVATLTRSYVRAVAGTRTRVLDTRKTTPGLRHLEKYAVRAGGGTNHRIDLAEMLMLKDTHLDRAGSITEAVAALRAAYSPCPPIEVECRTLAEVSEAVAAGGQRIMFDNMSVKDITDALRLVPEGIETEISGGVSLDTLPALAALGADFISVGRLTHSAPAADISMRVARERKTT